MTTLEKLRDCFDEMLVYKDLKKTNFFSALSLPSFMRDWLLKKFENDSGEFDKEQLTAFVKKYIPRKDDWISIKNKVVVEGVGCKFLAKISVNIDIKTGEVSFALPDFGLGFKETVIEPYVWENCKADLVKGRDIWGMVELGYRSPEDFDFSFEYERRTSKAKSSKDGKIKLVSFKNFCPYNIDIEEYKEARKDFTISEWIDIVLGAVDYNASGYSSEEQKLTMITRLLPFVEKRLNLIELAPKGTGKSYLFGNVSRFGWLSSGGTMSRAKMFYDQNRRREGLISSCDFVTLDEVQTISFTDSDEMRAALKGYMEQGNFTVGDYKGVADAGIILCGNISQEIMNSDGYANMFKELPEVFHESALIDRFHGFIKGWDIPKMKESLKANGWALNTEYFGEIIHMLRDELCYRAVVDQLLELPKNSATRDTEAIKRICTAYLKLLFPNATNVAKVNIEEFETYCLEPAKEMRRVIKTQLGIMDRGEFGGKTIPDIVIKEQYRENN